MYRLCSIEDWRCLDSMTSCSGAEFLQQRIQSFVSNRIPTKFFAKQSGTHPWLNERCLHLVTKKIEAGGTSNYAEVARKSSEGLYDEFIMYTKKIQVQLKKLPSGSKKWWELSKTLLMKPESSSTIPPLRRGDGSWAFSNASKADLFAAEFLRKWCLPRREGNFIPSTHVLDDYFVPVRLHVVVFFFLLKLDINIAVGPDDIAPIILKKMALALAIPLVKLIRRIIFIGIWLEIWMTHWIFPLFKRSSPSNAENYRGIHLALQISKVVERILAHLCITLLVRNLSIFGENQFAYTKNVGRVTCLLFWFYYGCLRLLTIKK